VRGLIGRVRDGDPSAWVSFIDRYAPLILQAVGSIERDRDDAADAFVFACERLRERHAARLSTFDPTRAGSFDNWLRAVAVNLARDARRRRTGRLRPLAIVRALAPLEQRVFRLRHEFGFTFEQALSSLKPEFPGLTESRLAEADATVASCVSARERWTLLTRRPRFASLSTADEEWRGDEPQDKGPDPEWVALARESRAAVAAAMKRLAPQDRLLVRLRVERGLTFEVLAGMFGLANPQAAHRRWQEILQSLRVMLEARA